MTRPRLYSGMQPSADSLQIGNYIGALMQWRDLQQAYDAYFSVVDLHALTQPNDPGRAAREDPAHRRPVHRRGHRAVEVDAVRAVARARSTRSSRGCCRRSPGFGEAGRMTQFKDKSARYGTDATNVGLFTYPVLMAADILLYQTDVVPVGDDQKQHVELTRDLAERFNSRYGTDVHGADARHPEGHGAHLRPAEPDGEDVEVRGVRRRRAVDARRTVGQREEDHARGDRQRGLGALRPRGEARRLEPPRDLRRPHRAPDPAIEDEYAGRGYGDFKKGLAEVVVAEFGPVRERALELLDDPAELDRVLAANAARASRSRAAPSTTSTTGSGCSAGRSPRQPLLRARRCGTAPGPHAPLSAQRSSFRAQAAMGAGARIQQILLRCVRRRGQGDRTPQAGPALPRTSTSGRSKMSIAVGRMQT